MYFRYWFELRSRHRRSREGGVWTFQVFHMRQSLMTALQEHAKHKVLDTLDKLQIMLESMYHPLISRAVRYIPVLCRQNQRVKQVCSFGIVFDFCSHARLCCSLFIWCNSVTNFATSVFTFVLLKAQYMQTLLRHSELLDDAHFADLSCALIVGQLLACSCPLTL